MCYNPVLGNTKLEQHDVEQLVGKVPVDWADYRLDNCHSQYIVLERLRNSGRYFFFFSNVNSCNL
uniref:Uncharacterized protein n=2 Tax=unclassified Rosemountvirus TaxID=2738372 RepID=A0AAU8GH20_9CAUD